VDLISIVARGRQYYCGLTKAASGEVSWSAYDREKTKIPCFTDRKEHRFPVLVARMCSQLAKEAQNQEALL